MFAKRVVIGNSWKERWQTDSGMAKLAPFSCIAAVAASVPAAPEPCEA